MAYPDFPSFPSFPSFGARAARPAVPYLSPEEEASMLSQLGGGVMGGLGYLGETLDKPGRAVRGLLAGRPGELLNLLPFSDTLGITDPRQAVSGRDLLTQWGMTEPNKETGWVPLEDTPEFMRDVAGFGAEVLLDPLTYVGGLGTLKALAPAGQAAKAARVLPGAVRGAGGKLEKGAREALFETAGDLAARLQPEELARYEKALAAKGKTLADVAGERLGGNIGLGLPFSDNLMTFGSERLAKLADKAGDLLKYDVPGVSHVLAAFDPARRGQPDRFGATFAESISEGLPVATAAGKADISDLYRQAKEAGLMQPGMEHTLADVLEGVNVSPQHAALSANFRSLDDTLFNQLVDAGLLPETARRQGHAPRQLTSFEPKGKGLRPMSGTDDPFLRQRQDIFAGLTRRQLDELSVDPQFSGILRQVDPANMDSATLQASGELQQRFGIPPDQAQKLADYLGRLDQRHVERKIGIFGNQPLADVETSFVRGKEAIHAADKTVEMFKANLSAAGPDTVPLTEALKGAKLFEQLSPETAQALAGKLGVNVDQLAKLHVPREAADVAGRVLETFRSPKWAEEVTTVFDKVTNLFKFGVLSWPARYVRDYYSGQYMNWVGGLFGVKENIEAGRLMRGSTLESLADVPGFQNLTAEQATRKLADLAYQHNVLPKHYGVGDIGVTAGRRTGEDLAGAMPGEVPMSISETAKKAIPKEKQAWNPFSVRGVVDDPKFAPGKVTEDIGHFQEGLNRLSPFIKALRKGMDPAAAAARVRSLQVDYNSLTPYERKVMKRLVPFYAFTRRIAPTVVGELLDKPGGKMAQTIRASQEGRQEGGYLPSYLGAGMAVPLGESAPGMDRYLTGLDLPQEQVLGLFKKGPTALGTFEQTGMGLLGQLNPLIKGPLETMVGKQFFTGRDLADLDSRIGRLAQQTAGLEQPPDVPILLDQLLMNSPLARVASTAGTLMDPRKDAAAKVINLFTGARVSDVDMDKALALDQEKMLAEVLGQVPGARKFSKTYLPPELYNAAPKEIQDLFRLDKTLAKKRKEAVKKEVRQ